MDDLLATGGTPRRPYPVEQRTATWSALAFLIELAFLHGRAKLKDHPVMSLIIYD